VGGMCGAGALPFRSVELAFLETLELNAGINIGANASKRHTARTDFPCVLHSAAMHPDASGSNRRHQARTLSDSVDGLERLRVN
jgi:hypothetical protein